MTRPYAEVIGDPIAHSKSPLIHNFWLAKLGIDAEYRACHVKPDELADYFTRRRGDAEWRGCNVTIPHKVAVLKFANETSAAVREIGAANCLFPAAAGLHADNTDSAGVDAAIPDALTTACIIGAGGAARAAIPSLNHFCAEHIRVIARDVEAATTMLNSQGFAADVYGFDDAAAAFCGAEGVINASPLGMIGQPPMPQPVLDALGVLGSQPFVFDMVYAPLQTELLKAAGALGIETIDGLTMLIGQAKHAFNHFFGVFPDNDLDNELRALLTA
jgi:shikimate dehydrogenase